MGGHHISVNVQDGLVTMKELWILPRTSAIYPSSALLRVVFDGVAQKHAMHSLSLLPTAIARGRR